MVLGPQANFPDLILSPVIMPEMHAAILEGCAYQLNILRLCVYNVVVNPPFAELLPKFDLVIDPPLPHFHYVVMLHAV
jgi:hypothetical protein